MTEIYYLPFYLQNADRTCNHESYEEIKMAQTSIKLVETSLLIERNALNIFLCVFLVLLYYC